VRGLKEVSARYFKNTVVTRSGGLALLVVFHGVEEDIEQADQVCGTGHVLWVELNTGKKRKKSITKGLNTWFNYFTNISLHYHVTAPSPEQGFGVVHDALIGLIIGVGEEDVPVFGQGAGVDGEAVVLTGDEASIRSLMDARLVMATVTIPKRQEK